MNNEQHTPARASRPSAGIPHLATVGHTRQLIVDGKPYLALGGELHNSSASSPEYMAAVWDRLGSAAIGTVIGTASWQLVEPEEGRFDFTAVDDQIRQAHERGIRLVLIWFGAYKNAESSYAPSWVRRDEARFPRAERDPERLLAGRFSLDGPILSVFSAQLVDADARAFAAMMAHLGEFDAHHTVIAVQVENEVGLLGDSRDRSPLADVAWEGPVPPELIAVLATRSETLHPWLRELWDSRGRVTSGTWEEIFGADRAGEEVFMCWAFSRYVDRVAQAGVAEHPLPVFANAWLGPQPNAGEPGQYPTGGPVSRMLDVWKIGAPTLDFLAPDIYIEDFRGAVKGYARPDNPIFVPEARPDPALAFVAIGEFKAIGFNPFGIEDLPIGHDLFTTYAVLHEMADVILRAQSHDRIHGFSVRTGEQQTVEIGEYTVTISGPVDTRGMFGEGTGVAAGDLHGYGLILQSGDDEFVVVARDASVGFSRSDSVVEVDSLHEGAYREGSWRPRRVLNGDERHFMFRGELRTVRITVLRRHAAKLIATR